MIFNSHDLMVSFNFTDHLLHIIGSIGIPAILLYMVGVLVGINTENSYVNSPAAAEWLDANSHSVTVHKTWANERRYVVHKLGPLAFVGVMTDSRIVRYAEKCGWKRPHPINKI